MRTITMRAVDARHENKITQTFFEALVKEHGLTKGRNYPVQVEVPDEVA